jgi:putative nucleotidyltransferase with HDIG domain
MNKIIHDIEDKNLHLSLNMKCSVGKKCHGIAMSAKNELDLFTEVCGILMENGFYNFARIEKENNGIFGNIIPIKKLELHEEYFSFESSVSIPILYNEIKIASLEVYSDKAEFFDVNEIVFLETVAQDISYGMYILNLKNQRDETYRLHRESLLKTIDAFVLTMKRRDPYTAGHQQRVSELAKVIGEKMGLCEERIEGIRLGAMIHDIGKINVPGEILNRPGKITKNEFELIKPHSQFGHEIVRDISFPWPIAEMILQHHERLDGMGYPNGLSEGDIILEAKIISVADVVEAISSHRPYRVALGIKAALNEIKNGKGTSFDPEIVDICVDLFERKEFHWKNNRSFLEEITAG